MDFFLIWNKKITDRQIFIKKNRFVNFSAIPAVWSTDPAYIYYIRNCLSFFPILLRSGNKGTNCNDFFEEGLWARGWHWLFYSVICQSHRIRLERPSRKILKITKYPLSNEHSPRKQLISILKYLEHPIWNTDNINFKLRSLLFTAWSRKNSCVELENITKGAPYSCSFSAR